TDKYRKEDPRNDLVLEMARVVKELTPQMVMMENVPGLASRGKPTLDIFVSTLAELGYIVKFDVLQVADYGIPQSRRRLVLLAGMGFIVPFPARTHSYRGDDGRGLRRWLTLRDAIGHVKCRPVTLLHANRNGGPRKNRR